MFLFAQKDPGVTLLIKDKTQYSKQFIAQLKSYPYTSHYELLDSLLIIGRLDTAYFPTDLPIHRLESFSGAFSNEQIKLTITRINYTTLSYRLLIYKSKKLFYSDSGNADIQASFFLGLESDEDQKTGLAYGATEYFVTKKNCSLSIRIGKNYDGILCAKIKNHCIDKSKDVPLDSCPTLYLKK